jgi:1,4-dihydroxy-2-naphthoate octaprenyltransferase
VAVGEQAPGDGDRGGLEVLRRDGPEARRLAWSPSVRRDGTACIALLSDPGRLGTLSRLSRLISPSGERHIVVRYVPAEAVRRRRPPIPVMLLRALRWETLSAGLVPAGLGVALGGPPDAAMAAAILGAVLALHAAANLGSEAYEHVSGDDAPLRWGGSKVLESGALSATSCVRLGGLLGLLGVALGIALVWITRSTSLLLMGAAGTVLAWQFSAPPLRLRRGPLGDLVLMLIFGPLLLCGARRATGGAIDGLALAAGLLASLPAAVLRHLRNVRRLPDDAMLGHGTIAARLSFRGNKLAIAMAAAALLVAPALAPLAAAPRLLPAVMLLAPAFVWALRPALGAFGPHDPAITQSFRRWAGLSWVYGIALIALWAADPTGGTP